MEKVPYFGHTLTRWQVGPSTFLALPERGARLLHWHVTLGDGSVRDVLYWPEGDKLENLAKVRGGNPILFPFNARVFDQGEIHVWRGPDGVRRPMPMHGFARQGTFKVTREDERGFAASLVPSEEAKAAYPFAYDFTVIYRFSPLGLSCEFVFTNHDTQPLPWSAGHHFYFSLPWTENHSRGDYAIRIPATKVLRQDEKGQLVAGPKLQAEERFNNPELIEALHVGLKSHEVVFGPAHSPGEVRMRIGTAKTPPPETTVVTWTQSDDAPFYCVEPWMGPPNAPEHKVGLHWVQPGQQQSFVVELAVK